MRGRRPSNERRLPDDPLGTLGLGPGAGRADIERARRALAKHAHPDIGGTDDEMQRINAAADAALAAMQSPAADRDAGPDGAPDVATGARAAGASAQADRRRRLWRDHPSFTIEALPAEAFEALLVAASWLGETLDDDPPYRLELILGDPIGAWCRLDLVPDAGSTTVGITVAADRPVDVDLVRDVWIEALNSLDW